MSRQNQSGPRKDRRPRTVRESVSHTNATKAADVLQCEGCGIVQHAGRWRLGPPPLTDVHAGLCPACRRIRDRHPAGTVRLPIEFLKHIDEIRGMLENLERAEREEHPLERLMGLETSDDGALITTTGIHLAKRITTHLERRFHRKARVRYPSPQDEIQVDWEG